MLWEDLAEIRTIAVARTPAGTGVGPALVARLIGRPRDLGLRRLFVLTFETAFFARHGFVEIDGTPVSRRCTRRCGARPTRASPSSSTCRT